MDIKDDVSRVTTAITGQKPENACKILIVHSEGNVNNNPNLSGLVEILCENGYAVDIASPRRKKITQQTPHPQARLLLTENLKGTHGGEFVLLADKALSSPQQIIQAVRDNVDNYDLVIGVDRSIVEASLIASVQQIPCGYISYEIFFEEETGFDYKQPEILACRDIAFAVCQDPVRGGLLCQENQIPPEKMLYIPVAGRGCVARHKNFALHDKLGIEHSKKIAIYIGSVSNFCMSQELIQSALTWPDDWILVMHNRYGLDKNTRPYYQKYANSSKIYFSCEPVDTPAQLHTLLNSAELGIAFYTATGQSKWTGNNIRYIGLASGKISTYLQHGLPVLMNEQVLISDYVRRYDCGYVYNGPLPIPVPRADGNLQRWSDNAHCFFKEHLDLNKAAKPLLEKIAELVRTRSANAVVPACEVSPSPEFQIKMAQAKDDAAEYDLNNLPILIYQMGKVGSASIKNSLDRLNIANEHVHFLSAKGIESLNKFYENRPGRKVSRHLFVSQKIRRFMQTHPRLRWKVISLVRDPVAQDISAYFQGDGSAVLSQHPSMTSAQIADLLVRHHQQRYWAFDESRDLACRWFDLEIKEVFNFDIFSQPFDAQKGYQIYHCPDADILLLQLEKLDGCAAKAFREFLGIENFQLIKKNIAEEKEYHEVYTHFLSKFKLNHSILDKVYNTRFVRYFYTAQQIQQFYAKWKDSIPARVDDLTYSRLSHFDYFKAKKYDIELFGKEMDISSCNLKTYQDLLVFAFIRENIPKGSRILDVGGGDSRILKHFYKDYECWNIDKLEGLGNGCKSLDTAGRYRLVQDYMGNFNSQLPDNYFDFVFSISALEHVPDNKPAFFQKIRDDINRVLKPGGYTLHCFDIVIKKGSVWTHPLLRLLFKTQTTMNHWVSPDLLRHDADLYVMSEQAYNRSWKKSCMKSYEEFGKPLSYNVLWRKASVESNKTMIISGPNSVLENSSSEITAKQTQPILLATSLAPKDIENQRLAVQSWLDCGFDVISVNNPDEIQTLSPHFDKVRFVSVSRNGLDLYGRPLVYIDDILEALKTSGREIVGVINSDIHLRMNDSLRETLRKEAAGSLVYTRRINVERLDDPNGTPSAKGIDLFVMDRAVLAKMPSSRFCLGTSWWDCFLPLFCATSGIPLKWLNGRFAIHVKHTLNWNHDQWVRTAEHLFDCMYQLSLDKSKPSVLTEMEKQWLAYRTFYYCLRQGIVVKRRNKQMYLGSRCAHALINQATQIITCDITPVSAVQINENLCSDRDAEDPDCTESAASIQPQSTLIEALRFYRQAMDASAVGNMVTARRRMAQYQSRMDYSAIPAIDRRVRQSHPLLSVIISACSSMDNLTRLITCLAAQTVNDYEVIVVDNNGIDIPSAAQKVHCVIPSLVDGNPTEGRNIGVHFARGQIVVFLDDDAVIKPDYLAHIVKAFETHDILGLRGRILSANPSRHHQNAAWDRGDKPFPTLCNQERNAAFMTWAWKVACGADPLLNGHEGTDLSWRLMQAFGRPNATIYWPDAVVYYDSPDALDTRQKEIQYKNIRSYLLYKYDRSIYSIREAIEKSAITAGNALSAQRPMFAPNAAKWRSLCYQEDSIKIASISSPKVSVVISCFNAQEYLRECLDSVRAQTLTDWEAIIVDDGSTDDTHQILKEYADKDSRFVIHLNTDNKGPYIRRNFALSRTRAQFIAIHDADDIMAPRRLEYLLDEILKDDQLAIVGSFYGWFLGRFRGIEYCDVIPISITHPEIMNTFSRTHYICCHAAAIIRKSFLDCIGLYDQQPWGADTFWLTKAGVYSQLTGQVRFRNIPECLSFIRKHGNSQTGKINPNDPRSRRQYLARYYMEKLQRIVEKKRQYPNLDVGRELQLCTCRDFIPQFGHLFSQWESVPVTEDMLKSKLSRAVEEFSHQSYVKAAMFCDTLCQMSPQIYKTCKGFNLIRGLSHFACGEDASAKHYLEQEYADHKTVQAQRFLDLYMNHQALSLSGRQKREIVDRFVFAYPQISRPDAQVVYDNRKNHTPQVSVIMDCRQQEIDFENLINTWAAQDNKDFELILVNSQCGPSDFVSLPPLPVKTGVINIDALLSTAAAKNIAVSQSHGGIILFVWPQVKVNNNLIRHLIQQMTGQNVSAIRGRIRSSQQTLLCPEYDLGDQPLYCSTDTDMLCAVRRTVLQQAGPLDTGVFDYDLLFVSAKIYGDNGPVSQPVMYDPQMEGILHGTDCASNFLLRTIAKEQLFWRLSAPQWYMAFLSFTESESGGSFTVPGIQFSLRQRFPSVVLEWVRRIYKRIPDTPHVCYLLADLEWENRNYDQAVEMYQRFLRLPALEPIARQVLDEKVRQIHAVTIDFYLQSYLRLIEYYTLRNHMDVAGQIAGHVLSNKNLTLSTQTVRWIEDLLQTSKSMHSGDISDLRYHEKKPETIAAKEVQQAGIVTII